MSMPEYSEDLVNKCIEIIRSERMASVSLLQRRLRLGYCCASTIMRELENKGIVGPANGSIPRAVLISNQNSGAATG